MRYLFFTPNRDGKIDCNIYQVDVRLHFCLIMGNYFLSQFENYSPEIHAPSQRFLSLYPFLKHTSWQNLLTFKATSCLVAFQTLRPVHTRCDLYRTILLYYCAETKEVYKAWFPLDREIVGFK